MSKTRPNPLLDVIRSEIGRDGPISVERYMALCLGHPDHGAYMAGNPIGAGGDFTTAPEISQMFGELIGLWCADLWLRLERPAPFLVVELGPGRGSLMADAIRAMQTVPGLPAALELHLVETSPLLREAQSKTLLDCDTTPHWHDSLGTVARGPMALVANEFFDCLPIRQYVCKSGGWHERLIGLDAGDKLRFELSGEPSAVPGKKLPRAANDTIAERCPAAVDILAQVCDMLLNAPGCALIIDYGSVDDETGDTLQAVYRHTYADPLSHPGRADLSAHVDFTALSRILDEHGTPAFGPMTQGAFLKELGLDARAQRLSKSATRQQKQDIDNAVERLTAPDQMGELFKVLAAASPALGAPQPFESVMA